VSDIRGLEQLYTNDDQIDVVVILHR